MPFLETIERFLGHAMFQSVLADESGGFHQGAGGIAQQYPVDGEMDVCFDAGAVEIHVIEADRLC